MIRKDPDLVYAQDLFGEIPNLITRKIVGGVALYSGNTIFGLLRGDGRILIKAEPGPFADRMAAMGSESWKHTGSDGKTSAMPYWDVPDAVMDDPDAVLALARDALAAGPKDIRSR